MYLQKANNIVSTRLPTDIPIIIKLKQNLAVLNYICHVILNLIIKIYNLTWPITAIIILPNN